ncbi:aminotransferase class V-fold PLP-dependent enzyme [Microlunatus soli]|uniref:Selenocysteine lyase/Cysteine desulfurase n=1 Tax=Microlunatus soli TaxID=630515 RepID=A0A1H1TC22_9ACTN|nr:aminotransferase class V-fold PLP-dependent enzyme [Microlunatus soli]SDS57621.1 Selenocysteine lyase/Cysteine desulfurase [Microlunatus soli]
MQLDGFRQQFPITERLSWLATPSCAPAASPVLRAVRAELDRWADGDADWTERDRRAEACRRRFAELLGRPADQVALLSSTAEAAATVAGSVPSGGRIVVGEREYRSNIYPWLAAERRGVTVAAVPMPDGLLDSGRVCEAIIDGTSLVSVSVVQSATGSRVDLIPIAERCREVGARLFLDATQSAGVLSIPAGVDPDFVAAHGYKWLLGVRGTAYLAVRRDRLTALGPLAANSRTAGAGAGDYGGPLSYADGAERLDLPLSWPVWAAAEAGLELLGRLDPIVLQQHCLRLAEALADGARDQGLAVMGSERPSQIVTLRVPDAERAVGELTAAGVRATARNGNLRFGFHGFSAEHDVEQTLAVLRKVTG